MFEPWEENQTRQKHTENVQNRQTKDKISQNDGIKHSENIYQ